MAEALVSLVVEQLGSIMVRELEQEVRLVVGVKGQVENLKSNLTAIKAVLADAETKQVKEDTTRDWLEKLKDVTYDIEDVLDDWEAAILNLKGKPGEEQVDLSPKKKVCSFLRSSCFYCQQVGLRHDIANKIKKLNESLDKIALEKERYHSAPKEGNPTIERLVSTSMIDITEVTGRKEDKSILINMLMSEHSDSDKANPRVISIVGMGGIGKTTLAQLAFNDNMIKTYFDKKIWICVSDPFDQVMIAKTILESLLGHTPDVQHLQGLLEKIRESIKNKKFLLVLDDVWEENPEKWEQLKQSLSLGLPGSKVLVTTRKENVASIMRCSKDDILKVRILSDEECWSIISTIAFFDRSAADCNSLEDIGKEISKKCRGLPLTAKALGGILQFKKTREQWQSLLGNKIWEVEETHRDVFGALWLSYYDLSPPLKRCFSYCAIFPKDYEIKKTELIGMWMAQGYIMGRQNYDLEITGQYYFQNLALRSFFQDFKKDYWNNQSIYSCKMHDIVHDFAQIVAQNECRSAQVDDPMELIRKVRHLCLDLPKHGSYLNPSYDLKKKRSILLWGEGKSKLTTEDLSRIFSELAHVRSLSLRGGDFAEIPSSISKLVHLRWLDLSHNDKLKKLPESLCELHNLHTIDITECHNLELPLGIGNLINLRHLHNENGFRKLPKGIAQLTGLRTLEWIDVCCDGDDAFSLGDLKNLNQLRGRLFIGKLGASNCHVGEAKQAALKKKEHITDLTLWFASKPLTAGNEELLEGLELSPNLEILQIFNYGGTTFPSWMISLTNLRSIQLNECNACDHLPSFGKLPSLETLTLYGMEGVKKVGVELLGMQTQIIGDSKRKSEISASSSSSSSSLAVVAFPKLTKLEFDWMRSWEEWDDYYDGTVKPPPAIIIMPSLRSLKIDECPRLKALPDYILKNTMLQTLQIRESNLLRERYNKENGEDWSKISHISDFRIW